MDKDELVAIVEELIEDSALEFDDKKKTDSLIKKITSNIYEFEGEIDVTQDEIKESLLKILPDDQDWELFADELSLLVMDYIEETADYDNELEEE
jgi:hypothetical protein